MKPLPKELFATWDGDMDGLCPLTCPTLEQLARVGDRIRVGRYVLERELNVTCTISAETVRAEEKRKK